MALYLNHKIIKIILQVITYYLFFIFLFSGERIHKNLHSLKIRNHSKNLDIDTYVQIIQENFPR